MSESTALTDKNDAWHCCVSIVPSGITVIANGAYAGNDTITSVTFHGDIENFGDTPFPGDLRERFLDWGGYGTYTREKGSDEWIKEAQGA